MISVQDFFAAALLFWPFILTVAILGCLVFIGLIVFLGGTVAVFCLFLYGLYCLVRDRGLLEWMADRLGHLRDYMTDRVHSNLQQSFQLKQTELLEKQKPCLYVCSPHGLYGFSWYIHFSAALTSWPTEVPRPVLAIHSNFYRIPFFQELLARNRCIEATEVSIRESLTRGDSVALLLGGMEEFYHTEPGRMNLILQKRKGYARIAKDLEIPIVPMLSIGENELFYPAESTWWCYLEEFLYRKLGIAFPLPKLSSVLSIIGLMNQPFQTPIETYCLKPIATHGKSTDDIRKEVLEAVLAFGNERGITLEILG